MAFLCQLKITRTKRLALPTAKRTFAISSVAMATRISDAIKQDHREIESYYEHIIGTSDQSEQERYQNQLTWELARHSIGEELVVYPAFEKYVPGGVELANKDRQEHQSVSQLYSQSPTR
jgi:hemerythrin superfamily protein